MLDSLSPCKLNPGSRVFVSGRCRREFKVSQIRLRVRCDSDEEGHVDDANGAEKTFVKLKASTVVRLWCAYTTWTPSPSGIDLS